MFVHLTVPIGQQIKCFFTPLLNCAAWGSFTGEPQFGSNQWQQRSGGKADCIKLRFDETIAGVNFARCHQFLPAFNPLAIAPVKRHMVWKRLIYQRVICIAQKAIFRVDKFGVVAVGQAPGPLVLSNPAG